MKILIVDDEAPIRQVLEYNLQREGFETIFADNGPDAIRLFDREDPGLVILDLMLPGMSGAEVCRRIRDHSLTPIIMLTARTEETDRVVGLEIGADDYVTKPFSVRELVARVKAHLRRANAPVRAGGDRLLCDDLVLDLGQHTLFRAGEPITLSRREFQLLVTFLQRRGLALSRRELLRRAWGDDSFIDERTVDVHVRWLREKIEAEPSSPRYIQTVRGVGYRFRPQEDT